MARGKLSVVRAKGGGWVPRCEIKPRVSASGTAAAVSTHGLGVGHGGELETGDGLIGFPVSSRNSRLEHVRIKVWPGRRVASSGHAVPRIAVGRKSKAVDSRLRINSSQASSRERPPSQSLCFPCGHHNCFVVAERASQAPKETRSGIEELHNGRNCK